MKKLLSILLAMSILLSFVACGDDKENKWAKSSSTGTSVSKSDNKDSVVEKEDGEDAAIAVVEDALDSFCELNLAEFASYTDAGDTEDLPYKDADDMLDAIMESAGDLEGMEDVMQPIFELVIEKIADSFSYEITEIEKDDDSYTVAVDFTTLDLTALGGIDSILEDGDYEDQLTEAMTQLMEDGDITEDMSEEEMMEAILPVLSEILESAITEAFDSVDTVDTELKFVVYEDGGDWVIDNEASDIDELSEVFSDFAE